MGRAKRHAPQKLPEKLRLIRERANLTMPELVEKLGCEEIPLYKGDISKYEAGMREPPLVILLKYAKLGKTTVESLIDDDAEIG